jgi:hypothetical protein
MKLLEGLLLFKIILELKESTGFYKTQGLVEKFTPQKNLAVLKHRSQSFTQEKPVPNMEDKRRTGSFLQERPVIPNNSYETPTKQTLITSENMSVKDTSSSHSKDTPKKGIKFPKSTPRFNAPQYIQNRSKLGLIDNTSLTKNSSDINATTMIPSDNGKEFNYENGCS